MWLNLTVYLMFLFGGVISGCRKAPGDLPPNMVFIMADDHALEAIGSYGTYLEEYVVTPHIDRLAAEGMRFTNVCCNNSICSPSRASILTGQYSHKNGVLGLNQAINEESPWFSVELQEAGYATCVVGKWHLESWPRGFDDYWITKGQGAYFNPKFYTSPSAEPVSMQGYSADVYTDVAIEWLKNGRDGQKPFILCLHFKGPHHPYDYPERNAGLHQGVDIPEPGNLYEDLSLTSPLLKEHYWAQLNKRSNYFLRHADDKPPDTMWPYDPENDSSKVRAAYQHMMHKYLRCVKANDDNVGRVLDYLESEGLTDRTIVIYTSDQGYWLGQHGFYDKRLILDESLKMPLLVRFPVKIKPGSVSDELISNVDFAPTMLDLAGLEIPEQMQGKSFREVLYGTCEGVFREACFYAYWATWPAHWGIRARDFTYVEFPQCDSVEYYDLVTDPWQNINQGMNAEYTERIKYAGELLEKVIADIDMDPGMLPHFVAVRKDRDRN